MKTSSLMTGAAVAAGKAVDGLIHLLNAGAGTSLPGKIARKFDAQLLGNLAGQIREHRIAVSGTNGKTTTCGLLAQLLREANKKVIHNQLGANMVPGITAALLKESTLAGKLDADVGVFEVDEASLKGFTSEVAVDRILVTNLFRDQLDRYGELDTTAKMILKGIEQMQGRVILNADDPLVAGLGQATKENVAALGKSKPPKQVLYYGVDSVDYGATEHKKSPVPYTREVTTCPACHQNLHYTDFTLGHLGHYDCAACGYKRPQPHVRASHVRVTPEGSHITLTANGQQFELFLPLPGLFNVYNLLAALAVVADLYPAVNLADLCAKAVTHYQSVFGRAERKTIDGKNVLVLLIKNPVGASEVLKLVGSDPNGRLLIALNDNYADGRDVSWIWDVRFDHLMTHYGQKQIVLSGQRADDLAVRLKYAGFPSENLLVEADLSRAVKLAVEKTPAADTLYLLPTYTALLQLRNII